LNAALKVPQVIWEKNAGNPFSLLDIASKLGSSPTSSTFRELIRSSQRYGLTNESFTQDLTKTISLTRLGNSVVAPTPEEHINTLKRTALETPDLFQKVYSSLQGKIIPPPDSIKNMLIRNYHLDKHDADICYEILRQNIDELGLTEDIQGKSYLRLDKLGTGAGPSTEEGAETEKGEEEISKKEEMAPKVEEKQIPKQIFVAHGKNKRPLEQLEKILSKFKVPYKVAVEEPHSGRPVSKKVADLMKQCTSGIFIFTADEKTQDEEGKEILRPSVNVVYELGAASVLYENKIVIFKEEGVSFGSDFSDIGYISFEKDKLDTKAADLMLELINLGFVQLTPT
jgi:hypothetical protein